MRQTVTDLRTVSRSHLDRSRRVIGRFGLKLAVFSFVCGFGRSGHP
jgi:hypothetical protein